jgi:hypothetical protein
VRGVEITHETPRFDWYQGTAECSESDLIDLAWLHLGDEPPVRVQGRNGYARGYEIRWEGSARARVFGGGQHRYPHMIGTGPDAVAVAALLRRWSDAGQDGVSFPHRVSRCDVAVDTDSPGAFPLWLDGLRAVARQSGVKGRIIQPDQGEEGATYYIGANSSESMGRLYEKGKQLPAAGRPAWVRYELQYRPKRERKSWAATTEPAHLLGAALWARRFAGEFLDVEAAAAPTHLERVSDLEGALRTVTSQYGQRFLELLERHQGDLGLFGQELIWRSMNGGVLGGEDPES